MKTKNVNLYLIAILFSISSFAQENSSHTKSDNGNPQKITKDQLLETKNIEEVLSNFPKNDYVVTHYKLSIYEMEKDPAEFENDEHQLTVLMKERIKSASPGAKIYVEYIKGKLKSSNDGITRQFPPSSFVITEK